eukprot:TRINITY_DN22_c0_g1_i1.p1 TRINITY_DN22_c0_g1~~TRINITY_DN22_c0_g1_i1.p1  ORF type:complete len:138 (-),score=15.40 TRINITY_DN22_c0_g1_i1:213-626(-)
MSRFGGAPKCPRCAKSVYHAEEAIAAGKKWHQKCLKCPGCNKRLDSTSINERDGEVYCSSCYGKNFGPKGYGFAGGAAMMHTEDPGQTRTTPAPRAAAQPASRPAPTGNSTRPKFCSSCGARLQATGNFCGECGTRI